MSAVYAAGVTPLRGDQVRITKFVAPTCTRTGTLTVHWTQPTGQDGWAYVTGTWPDGSAGRVMVWLDRVVVRRTG